MTLDMSSFGALIADRNRAALLVELLDGRRIPASELAARVGLSRSLASAHLVKLERAGVVTVEAHGRRRLYELASGDLAEVIERLSTLSPAPPPPRTLRAQSAHAALRYARSCYDHLAGELGVELALELERRELLRRANGTYVVSPALVAELDLDVRSRRPLARPCLDWTERRDHVAGLAGQALLSTFLDEGWLVRQPKGRGLDVTKRGAKAFAEHWNIVVR
ncbi:MAG TPA: helix-turn-helix domain-containing protein [Gaiellaceae bacterium]|nr:helix-turn-helix domain-containing protein [Gaiellaceae bacterium]